jgi:hypothetical protein
MRLSASASLVVVEIGVAPCRRPSSTSCGRADMPTFALFRSKRLSVRKPSFESTRFDRMKNDAPDVVLRYLRVVQMVAQMPPSPKSVAMTLKTMFEMSTGKIIVSKMQYDFQYAPIMKVLLTHYHSIFSERTFLDVEGGQCWLCPSCRSAREE